MKIGLTYTGSDQKHENYVRWLQDGDPGIEVVRLQAGVGMAAGSAVVASDPLAGCDALVLSGGIDIYPGYYEGALDYTKAPSHGWEKERDLFERAALESAWERGLPVLGVCRGLQLINVACKGTLVQDLGPEGDETHENETGADKEHPVRVFRGTLLHEVTEKEEGIANSAHHQAIGQLGEGLRVNCRAGDGTIEGIEWEEPEGKPFLLALQWHPERMYTEGWPHHFLYKQIRDRLVDEIRKTK